MIKFFLKILNIKLEHVGVPIIKNPSGFSIFCITSKTSNGFAKCSITWCGMTTSK